jgi:hypothetical protein
MQPYVAVWNTSQNILETIVERRNSSLIQHKEAFSPFIEALHEKGAEVSGTMKNHGGEVIIEALFKDLFIDDSGDKIQVGARLSNNYNSKSGPYFRGEFFGFRSMCSNGMILGKVMVCNFSAKHNKIADLQKRMMEFVGSIYTNATKLQEIITDAKKEKLDDDEAEDILLRIFRRKKFVKKLQDLFEKGQLTRYTVYNALTNYATFKSRDERQRVKMHQVAQRVLVTPKSKLTREWDDD